MFDFHDQLYISTVGRGQEHEIQNQPWAPLFSIVSLSRKLEAAANSRRFLIFDPTLVFHSSFLSREYQAGQISKESKNEYPHGTGVSC